LGIKQRKEQKIRKTPKHNPTLLQDYETAQYKIEGKSKREKKTKTQKQQTGLRCARATPGWLIVVVAAKTKAEGIREPILTGYLENADPIPTKPEGQR
jgi:hypothetical protein